MPPSGGKAAGRGERRKRGGAPPDTIRIAMNTVSYKHRYTIIINFYANLVIRRRSQCLERVCECGRLRLQSSPRDPASQTTTPRSCSHHRSSTSNRPRPTQNARAHALLAPGLLPLHACVQGHHVAARRAQRMNHSPRYRCRCRPPPLPLFLGCSSGSQLAIPACLQQARRHRRQRAALRHRLPSPPRRRKM